MLNFTSVTFGLLTAYLLSSGLKAIAAVPVNLKSDKTLYAQGVFDFNNGERRLSVGQSPSRSIDGPNPKPYLYPEVVSPGSLFNRQAEQRAEEQRQFYYLYPSRLPEKPKVKNR
jgi:hypothetical protein